MEFATNEEHETVELTLRSDDGEAMTAALAIHRGGEVATDDRKAIRVLESRSRPVPMRRTSSLLRTWVRRATVPAGPAMATEQPCSRLRSTSDSASAEPTKPVRSQIAHVCPGSRPSSQRRRSASAEEAVRLRAA